MTLKDFKPFKGQHCETTVAGCLLNQLDIHLSEPMLFGLGEGLGFLVWNMKTMDFPFIGGRIKSDVLTERLCDNLNLKLNVKETSSLKKAWRNVDLELNNDKAVGLKLDCYHLEYFSGKFHFAGHYATMYGYDEKMAYLVDTDQQGGSVKTSLESLALARNERGPMSSKNKSYTIDKIEELPELGRIIKKAIYNNALDYLNPPIKNFGYKGIEKTAYKLKTWFKKSENKKRDFQLTASLMERAGTGGALFRNLYRDFLSESYDILKFSELKVAHEAFIEIANLWTEVSELFHKVGETEDEKHLESASAILLLLSEKERECMENLKKAFSKKNVI